MMPGIAPLSTKFGGNIGRARAAVKVTLNAITAVLPQEVGLPLGFYPFGIHRQA